jgi:hypothetical protein
MIVKLLVVTHTAVDRLQIVFVGKVGAFQILMTEDTILIAVD